MIETIRRLNVGTRAPYRRRSRLVFLVISSATVLGVGLVMVPAVRAVSLAFCVAAAAWIFLLPKGWFAGADVATRRIILLFLGIRLAMPLVSTHVASDAGTLFTGGSDAFAYHEYGIKVANELLTSGQASSQRGPVPGTAAMDLAVGYLYTVGAPVRIVTYYLWNVFATIGMLLFWWSTNHLTVPRRSQYTTLVLLAPSLLFWNSGLSKEAPMTLATGCVVAGVSLLSGHSRTTRGLAYLLLGVAVAGFVRPHIALLMVASALVGVAISRAGHDSGARGRRLLPLVFAAALLVILIPVTRALFDSAGEEASLVEAAYARAEDTAAVGGRSGFETSPTRSVGDMPGAVVTVLFRPFPWEVRTVPQLLASVEAVLIGTMLAAALLGLVKRRRRFERTPLTVMSVTFTLLFSAAFASLGNFGLLVRERSQVLAFVILLVFSLRTVSLGRSSGREPMPPILSLAGHNGSRDRTRA